jgi:hypothetical protein
MLHRDISTLTIGKWNKIIKSDGKDLKPLFKYNILSFLAPIMKKKLKKANEMIYESFDKLDLELVKDYNLWQINLTDFQLQCIKKKIKDIESIYYQDLEEAFKNYLRNLQSKNKDFSIKQYQIKDNYKEIYKELFKLDLDTHEHLKKINKLKGVTFYTKDEYYFFTGEYPEIRFILSSDVFFNNLIEETEIITNELEKLDEHLLKVYMYNKMYDRYQIVRANIFDMHLLNGKSKGEIDVIGDMARINRYLNVNMNLKSTVSEFEKYKDIAKREIENQKPNNGSN